MTKLSRASVRLVLKRNRCNSLGENPVYIVVQWYGRCEKTTGVFVHSRHWNVEREEVKKSCSNYIILNKMLCDIKNRVIEKRNRYEIDGTVYTSSMLLENYLVDLSGSSNVFIDIMNCLMSDRRLKFKTCQKYRYCYKKLQEHFGRDNFIINELNIGVIKDFLSSNLCSGLKDSVKRDLCSCISSVFHYAIDKGINVEYPFKDFKFCSKYKQGNRVYCIDLINIRKLKKYWIDLCIKGDLNGLWSYKDGIEGRLLKRSSKEFCILFFLAQFYMNGSSPVDVALLKVENCKRIQINGEEYWALDFKRKKTNSPVHVRLKRDGFCIAMLEHFMGYSSNGFVYPVITNSKADDRGLQKQVNKFTEVAVKRVREAFMAINEATISSNIENGLEEPLVDIDEVTMNVARHSFASAYLNSPGASVRGVASLLSRSPNSISVYVHALKNDKDIADAVSFIDD